MKIFLDANIFFAATRSPTGGSGFVLELAKKEIIEAITVRQVLLEAERNILKKLDIGHLNQHYQNLLEIKPKIQTLKFINLEVIAKLGEVVPRKDIPILLGTILSKSQFLITLDKKHFLSNEKLQTSKLPFAILNPGEFLRKYF